MRYAFSRYQLLSLQCLVHLQQKDTFVINETFAKLHNAVSVFNKNLIFGL